MAQDKRLFVGGLDKDSDYRLVKPNDYLDSLNVRNVLSNSNNEAGAVENIKGNTSVPFSFPLTVGNLPQVTDIVFYGNVPSSGFENLVVAVNDGVNDISYSEIFVYTNANSFYSGITDIVSELNARFDAYNPDKPIEAYTITDQNDFVSGITKIRFIGQTAFTVTLTGTILTGGNITPVVETIQQFSSQQTVEDYNVIGSFEDSENNSIYYFAFDKTNNKRDCILEYNILSDSTSVVYQDGRKNNPVLNFQDGHLITGITKVGDLLSWTDNYNRPRMIDVAKSKANEANIASAKTYTDNNFDSNKVKFVGLSNHDFTTGDLVYIVQDYGYSHEAYEGVAEVTATTSTTVTTNMPWAGDTPVVLGKMMKAIPEGAYSPIVSFGSYDEKIKYLDYHKHQPVHAPNYVYVTNPAFNKNNLFGSMWQFKTRYKYTDGQFSAWSGISDMQIALNYFSNQTQSTIEGQSIDNEIQLSYLDTIGDVNKIEIAARKGNTGEFFLVNTKDNNYASYLKRLKPTLTWTEVPSDYSVDKFYNDGIYPFIDKIEGDKLQDETPNKAKALTLIDDNRNAFGNYQTGYDNHKVDFSVVPLYLKDSNLDISEISAGNIALQFLRGGSSNASGVDFAYTDTAFTLTNLQSIDWSENNSKALYLNSSWKVKDTQVVGPTRKRKGSYSLEIVIPSSVNNFSDALSYVVSFINGITNYSSIYSTPHNGGGTPNNWSDAGFSSENQLLLASVSGSVINIRARHGMNDWSSSYQSSTINFLSYGSNPITLSSRLISTPNDIQSSYKSGAHHKFGIIYYDETGKAGNVNVSEDSSFYSKFPSERDGVANTATSFSLDNEDYGRTVAVADIPTDFKPPVWATHHQFVYSGNTTVDEFLQFQIEDFKFSSSPDSRLFLSLNSFIGQDYSYKSVKNPLIDYDYVEGDRVRFIGRNNSGTFEYFDKYYDFKISSLNILTGDDDEPIQATSPVVGGYWIAIEDPGEAGFTTGDSGSLNGLAVEIYRPKKNIKEELIPYKEVGPKYEINNPGTPNRKHSHPRYILSNGDVYYKPRTMASDNNNTSIISKFVEDYYLSDFNDTNHYSIGRSRLINDEASERVYPASITYSQPYFINSKSNRLSNFNPYNLPWKDYNESYGSIQALKTRDDGIIVFQENKVSKILVGKNIIQSPDGDGIVTAATEVLSNATEYAGDFGISTNPESLVQHGFVFYFCDIKRGAALRLSRDGITKISDANMRGYFRDKANVYTNINEFGSTENSNNYRLKAGYDPEYDEYVITFPQLIDESSSNWSGVSTNWGATSTNWGAFSVVVSGPHETVAFNELLKKWVSFYSYNPTYYGKINRTFVTFNGGVLYKHNSNNTRNNFYGTQYNSKMKSVFNIDPSSVKSYNSIAIEGDNTFEVVDISTDLVPDGVAIDNSLFSKKENIRYSDIPFGGPVSSAQSFAGIGASISYTDATDTLHSAGGGFNSLQSLVGMKIYKATLTAGELGSGTLIGVVNSILSDDYMTVTQDSGYSGDIASSANTFFYADLKSISANAEGQRIRGQYAIVDLTLPTANQSTAQELFAANLHLSKSELSNK